MKWPKTLSELPSVPTYIIIEIQSITYNDPYEDSRTASQCTTHYPSIISFDSEQEWLNEINERMKMTKSYQNKGFRAYKLLPAEIKMSVHVEVNEWQS